jgi:hypothetical protein
MLIHGASQLPGVYHGSKSGGAAGAVAKQA